MKLKDKVAVITGGNAGIGLATAKLFRDEGAKVAIIGRDQSTLDKTVKELGSDSFAYKGDVSSVKDLEGFFAEVKKRFGKIDVLFVNAGISKSAPISDVSETLYDETMDINAKGAFFTVKNAVPLMGKGSSIVMTSSIVAHRGFANSALYAASKATVASFAKSFAAELIEKGIRVNAVSPGPISTEIVPRNSSDPEGMRKILQQVTQKIPMNRLGLSEEVAKAVLFLASDESSFSTGADILVDGGMIIS